MYVGSTSLFTPPFIPPFTDAGRVAPISACVLCLRFARLGSPKSKKVFFVLGFARLALLCFAKIGCGSEVQNQKKCFLFWASLALHCFASRR